VDLKITYLQDVLPIRDISLISSDTIGIVGKDFTSAVDVLINGQKSPYFLVKSSVSIEAQIPDSQLEEQIRDVAVLSAKFTSTMRSHIALQIGDHPQYIDGVQRLVQRYLKLLLRNPGSDITNPTYGGGLGGMIAKHLFGSKHLSASDIAIAVSRTERQMMQLQSTNPNLADAERLAKATLLGVDGSDALGTVIPRIEIINQAGVSAISQLEF
jgi:hypothetical protein